MGMFIRLHGEGFDRCLRCRRCGRASRMLCVWVNLRTKAVNSPSCCGQKIKCQWLGIKQKPKSLVGFFRRASSKTALEGPVILVLLKQGQVGPLRLSAW